MEGQQSAGRNWWKIGGLSCLGILGLGVALVVVLIVVVVATSGGGGTGAPAGDQSGGGGQAEGAASPGGQDDPRAALGEELAVGDARWTVGSAVYATELQDQIMQESVEGSFVVVEYTFANAGNDELTVDAEYINLVDGDGNSYSISDSNTDFVPMEQDLYYEGVNPGTSRDGIAVFEVPPGVGQQELSLEVDGGEMFSGETGYIDLGVPASG